jgi:hypothetical protein
MQLDPLGPILGLLFEDGSSDYVLGVLSKSGIPTHFDLTPEEQYSHNTRKRGYRRQLTSILSAFDDLSRLKIAENLIAEMGSKDDAVAGHLQQVLASAGWVLEGRKLVPLGDTDLRSTQTSHAFNLTEEQWDLLKLIVEVYNAGCRSEFLLVQSMTTKPTLVYLTGCHPNVGVDAGETDFQRLGAESLIDLSSSSDGELRGKPTALGIRAIAENGRSSVAIVDKGFHGCLSVAGNHQ